MKSNRRTFFYVIQIAAGGVLAGIGLLLLFFTPSHSSRGAILIGSTMFFSGLLACLINRSVYTEPEKQQIERQEQIELKDERNIRIREKSAYMAYWVTFSILCVAIVILQFIIPQRWPLVLGAYLLLGTHVLCPYFFRLYYSKHL